MDWPILNEWLNLLLRAFHVFAGILWVGQTYYFTWLDGRMSELEREGQESADGRVWMVHSGGFYSVEKQVALAVPASSVHWFRWEAAFTWLSGFSLLVLVYYFGGVLVDETVADISVGAGTAISVMLLAAGWVLYDCLARWIGAAERALVAAAIPLVLLAAFGFNQLFSSRAAYIHLGALLGTIMTANVWLRILPAQRQMIRAAAAGSPFNPALAAEAKRRSKHNTFMAPPVVAIMVSNHFPTVTYGATHNWIVLSVLVVAGWAVAKILRRA